MKKIVVPLLLLLSLVGCKTETLIRVVTNGCIHTEILNAAKAPLKAKGYRLQIDTFNNPTLANNSISSGGVDASLSQKTDDLLKYNARVSKRAELTSAGRVYISALGLYTGTKTTLDDYTPGDKIVISDRAEDFERIMRFINEVFAFKFSTDKNNMRNKPRIGDALTVEYMNPDLIPEAQKHPAEAFYIMTGAQAYASGLSYNNILATERNRDYAFILTIRRGEENNGKIRALMDVLYSDEMHDFIVDHFRGLIFPYR
ncbi:MAG: Methionine-binding lipoprotein MetQ precursor [Tenericutes bacterium ADurb.Bin087]|nr:MAG: Methionine-binding lipoprotein MetQ precursor [Tenericutes bacterium ADurb.Bin087]